MFGWFKPKCPVSLGEKYAIEINVLDLIRLLGSDRLRSFEVITPESSRLPQSYRGTDECVWQTCRAICDVMSLDASLIDFHFFPEDSTRPAVPSANVKEFRAEGLFTAPTDEQPRSQIHLQSVLKKDPQRLIAVIAHELAHEFTYRHFPELFDDPALEPLTDLMPLFFGFGIFMANSVLREANWTAGNMEGWSISRSGYTFIASFGYAMACLSYLRNDRDVRWAEHLRPDAAQALSQGLKFLRSSPDHLLDSEPLPVSSDSELLEALREDLRSKQPTRHLRAVWVLGQRQEMAAAVVDEILAFVESKFPEIRADAYRAALLVPSLNSDQSHRLQDGVFDESPKVRTSVAVSLGPHLPAEFKAIELLIKLLSDRDPMVKFGAAWSLNRWEDIPQSVMAQVLDLVTEGARINHTQLQLAAVQLLVRLASDPVAELLGTGFFTKGEIAALLKAAEPQAASENLASE